MALVVRAPDVDHAVEAAADEFVVVVGDVGGEIGGFAAAADEHVVLDGVVVIRADADGAEPDCAVFFNDEAAFAEQGHGSVVGGSVIGRGCAVLCCVGEGALGLPSIELDAEQPQVVADLVEHQREAAVGQFLGRIVGIGVEPLRAGFCGDLGGEVGHVCAAVAAFGEFGLRAVGLLVAGEQGAPRRGRFERRRR